MTYNNPDLSIRDIRFDILRIIGLFCIILAHTNPPSLIFQLRNFDVPLMVIISGAVFGMTSMKKNYTFYSYLRQRIPRLLLPTWAFLIFFFVFYFLLFSIKGLDYPFSFRYILSSFALISGIGYVWIIKVFILATITGPFFLNIHKSINNSSKYFFLLLSFYILYELSYFYYKDTNIKLVDFFIKNYVFYIIPYGLLFGLGLRLPTLNQKFLNIIISIVIILFILLAYYYNSDHFIPTQLFKYPPRMYYLSYAIGVSLILYSFLNYKYIKITSNNAITFISSSSLWIYLWQILFLFVLPQWINNFIFKFIIISFLSIMITYIQKLIIYNFILKTKIGEKNRNLLTILFLK